MSREILLWQIRWLIYHYAIDRLYQGTQNPIWRLYEQALETGDWAAYREAYEGIST